MTVRVTCGKDDNGYYARLDLEGVYKRSSTINQSTSSLGAFRPPFLFNKK